MQRFKIFFTLFYEYDSGAQCLKCIKKRSHFTTLWAITGAILTLLTIERFCDCTKIEMIYFRVIFKHCASITSPINSLRARDQNLKRHWDLFFDYWALCFDSDLWSVVEMWTWFCLEISLVRVGSKERPRLIWTTLVYPTPTFKTSKTFVVLGDCAGLSSLRCLPRTTEIVPVSVSVATCTEEFHCMETCTVVHLVNHTSCHCSCDQNSRTCKGGQVCFLHAKAKFF